MNGTGKALGHLKTARPMPVRGEAPAKKHTVTLIPGDGVGEEVADAVVTIVAATGVSLGWERCLSGQRALARHGASLPQSLVDSVRKNKVALKGRIGAPIGGSGESPNVALRKMLGLFASVRPARTLPGLKSRYDEIDLVVIRENTEDIYAGIEHEVVPDVVESLKVVTEAASTRVARFAFEFAAREGRESVTCLHKANIMKMSDGLFLQCARRAAQEFPNVEYKEMIADNAMMQLVMDPNQFDVLVMGNMLGDIVSDLCAGLLGGLGAVPGIDVGDQIMVFEAIHGDAPHLEGKDLATPLPLLMPAVAMLRHLGENDAADRVMTGIGRTLAAGSSLTPDLGGGASLTQMTQAIVEAMAD